MDKHLRIPIGAIEIDIENLSHIRSTSQGAAILGWDLMGLFSGTSNNPDGPSNIVVFARTRSCSAWGVKPVVALWKNPRTSI